MDWFKSITHKEVVFINRENEISLRWLPRIWVFCGFDYSQHRYIFKALWGFRNKIYCGECAYKKELRIVWNGWPIHFYYF